MQQISTFRPWVAVDGEAGALDDVIGHPTTYRIAPGSSPGQKL